jgi:hypothetical protein
MTRKTWSAVAEAGGGGVVTWEETPPHPAQSSVAAKKKDVKTDFMIGPFRTYTERCLFSGLDASVLSHAAQAEDELVRMAAAFANKNRNKGEGRANSQLTFSILHSWKMRLTQVAHLRGP